MSFERYPAYKDSGVDWLGKVPGHWEVKRLRRLVDCLDGKRIPLNSAERADRPGNVPYWGANAIMGYVDQPLLDEELVLLGEDGAPFFDSVRPVAFRSIGPVWPNNHIHVLRPRQPVFTKFIVYCLNVTDYANFIDGSTRDKLTQAGMNAIPLPWPDPDEALLIATFLDRETAKIDALVAEQEKLIALLQEKRQAVISHAVTQGLDPSVPMKDSGVEWLGAVPAHWNVISLGRVSVERCDGPFGSGLKSDHYTESGALVIRLQNIRASGFHAGDPAYLDLGYFESELQRHNVVGGDVLIAGLGDDNNLVGRACVAPPGISPAMVKADCFRFRLRSDMAMPEFVAQQLSTGAVCDSGRLATGSTRSRIPLSVMSTRKVALPSLGEQQAIWLHIANESSAFDRLIGETQSAITLLQERRSALISAAVTGQIDVRAQAV